MCLLVVTWSYHITLLCTFVDTLVVSLHWIMSHDTCQHYLIPQFTLHLFPRPIMYFLMSIINIHQSWIVEAICLIILSCGSCLSVDRSWRSCRITKSSNIVSDHLKIWRLLKMHDFGLSVCKDEFKLKQASTLSLKCWSNKFSSTFSYLHKSCTRGKNNLLGESFPNTQGMNFSFL